MPAQVNNADIMNIQWEIYNRDTKTGKSISLPPLNPQANNSTDPTNKEENTDQGMNGDLAASGIILSSETPVGATPNAAEGTMEKNQNTNSNEGTNENAPQNMTTAGSASSATSPEESEANNFDMASEMTSFVKNQILAQANKAIQTQGNINTQQVLSLLA